MDKKIKRYIYLLNDVTNLLLSKERRQAEDSVHKLRVVCAVLAGLLAVSVIINIILLVI